MVQCDSGFRCVGLDCLGPGVEQVQPTFLAEDDVFLAWFKTDPCPLTTSMR